MILIFVLAAVLIAFVYFYLCQAALWKCLLIFSLCFISLNLLYLGFWAIVSLFVDTTKPLNRQSVLCRLGCVRIAGLGLGYCGVKVRVYGMEKLPKDRRFLLVCNHRSLFDPLIIYNKMKDYNISFVSKPSNMRIPVFGRIGYGAGSLSLDRENDRNALKTILLAADYIKRDICSMAIFPEGTRNKTENELLPFHAGSFKVAQKANSPLVIACIKNTAQVKHNMFRRITRTELHILNVISADEVKKMNTRELAAYSSELILNCLREGKK